MAEINLGRVVGPKGDPGDTPHIGENGHWWIGTTDTGVPAGGGAEAMSITDIIKIMEDN